MTPEPYRPVSYLEWNAARRPRATAVWDREDIPFDELLSRCSFVGPSQLPSLVAVSCTAVSSATMPRKVWHWPCPHRSPSSTPERLLLARVEQPGARLHRRPQSRPTPRRPAWLVKEI